jgi:hypothetical protein
MILYSDQPDLTRIGRIKTDWLLEPWEATR